MACRGSGMSDARYVTDFGSFLSVDPDSWILFVYKMKYDGNWIWHIFLFNV